MTLGNSINKIALDGVEDQSVNTLPVFERQSNVLNIIDFCNDIISVDLWPRQKFILKVFYNLPLDEEEKKEIEWLKENKGIIIPENHQFINFKELIISAGRRGSKSALASMIATYELYKILNIYNPQKYYGLIQGTIIYVLHVAAEEEQAQNVSDFVAGFVKNSTWFQPYIEKILEKQSRFFTKHDMDTSYPKPTIRVYSLTSNSSSIPGKGAKIVILDELARMMDTKGRLSGDAIYTALTPSVKTFKEEGKIIDIASPRTKSGIFYDLCEKSRKIESMLYFNYASWELNPNFTIEDFSDDFDKDSLMAKMEYGAEFGEVLDQAFEWVKIDKIITPGVEIRYNGEKDKQYVICVDTGLKHDRYAIAWGHTELLEQHQYVFVDGLKYYKAETVKDEFGNKTIEDIDLEEADNFVIGLIKTLKNVRGIFYDQYNSASSIQKLKKMGYRARETTFTNTYKAKLYKATKSVLGQERLKAYEKDPQGAIDLFIDEMKHIEIEIKGNIMKINAPATGPVVTDDLYDAVSNLVFILSESDPKKVTHRVATRPRIVKTHRWG
jgi:hypothetical protein